MYIYIYNEKTVYLNYFKLLSIYIGYFDENGLWYIMIFIWDIDKYIHYYIVTDYIVCIYKIIEIIGLITMKFLYYTNLYTYTYI